METTNGTIEKQWKNTDNLKPWKPGQSGNPSGRPKKSTLTEKLRSVLEQDHNGKTVGQALIDVVTREALKGDFRFAKEILDRMDGPIKQQVEHEVYDMTFRATFDAHDHPRTTEALPEAT